MKNKNEKIGLGDIIIAAFEAIGACAREENVRDRAELIAQDIAQAAKKGNRSAIKLLMRWEEFQERVMREEVKLDKW